MELKFDLHQLFKLERTVYWHSVQTAEMAGGKTSDRYAGIGESRAQGLWSPQQADFLSTDNKLYLKIQGDCYRFPQIGFYNLFYSDQLVRIKKSTLCASSTFLCTNGLGKEMHKAVLKNERITPNEVAIDRPFSKFISSMRKTITWQTSSQKQTISLSSQTSSVLMIPVNCLIPGEFVEKTPSKLRKTRFWAEQPVYEDQQLGIRKEWSTGALSRTLSEASNTSETRKVRIWRLKSLKFYSKKQAPQMFLHGQWSTLTTLWHTSSSYIS